MLGDAFAWVYMDLVLKGNTEKFPGGVSYGGVVPQTFKNGLNDILYC